MIYTDDKGRPFERPCREDFATDLAFVQAFHAWRDARTRAANEAFDKALRSLSQ